MPLKKHRPAKTNEQQVALEEAAGALECDESEERFDAVLRKVAQHKPNEDTKQERSKVKAKNRQRHRKSDSGPV
jgi:hypothetical protein